MFLLLLVDGYCLEFFLSLGTGGLDVVDLVGGSFGLFISAATVKLFVFNGGFKFSANCRLCFGTVFCYFTGSCLFCVFPGDLASSSKSSSAYSSFSSNSSSYPSSSSSSSYLTNFAFSYTLFNYFPSVFTLSPFPATNFALYTFFTL